MMARHILFTALAAAGLMLAAIGPAIAPAQAALRLSPVPAGHEVAVFAGGCFWGMEGVFEHVKGVTSVMSGYAGGSSADANYSAVSSERTRHAESVRIVYDPKQVSFSQLMGVFFTAAHDPTQIDGQYPDKGPSYRSAIFPQDDRQRLMAKAYIASLDSSKAFAKPIATRLETGRFYPAEAEHQDFMRRNPRHPYILRWDKPRLAKLAETWPALYRN